MKANQNLWVGALWQAAMPVQQTETEALSDALPQSVIVTAEKSTNNPA
ncbi:hypothetical protein [Shewanella colwelliana]|uniref:Uncharacterized protein n=1 Tax=Shewanella colwelliana TaxID=23 RepID=A0ABQ4NWF9_SHECO|nr:hypothetical protein [Shewanella colwelliana]MCZ4337973.1 hypothetical protein [Shewanella colwelliana]MDX1281114.1 hypothetical protein [Shewanella colwelliana]GIU22486.1 hypothetical protein TUM4644_14670 [Shewanella colwelliana]GIU38030.1 hypothetical protein TUM3794_09740 [Shewanella colwelliana]